ncbi:flagellar biosynthesis GTPase FlhF [Rossellomorea marisflavi]
MMTETEVIDKPLTDSPSSTEIQPIQTAIAEINVTPAITETSDFQVVLQKIPLRVKEANNLLENYRQNPDTFLENIDDEALDAQLKAMTEVSSFVKDIENSRKDIKTYMNGVRDQLLQTLDKRLQGASFNELERAQSDIKQLKKDVEADRRARRWDEIRETFEANVNRYPLLGEFAPELADLSRFKLLFPKLVSGAKTRKVKESDHTMVNETLYAWNTAIELMKANEWGLGPHDLNQLLTMFKQNPSIELVQREGRQIKINADAREKAKQEAEARRLEQERQEKINQKKRQEELARIQEQERQAKLKQDIEAQKRAEQQRIELEKRSQLQAEQERKRQAEYSSFGGQYKTIFKESFPLFMEYLFNNPAYHDVHASVQTKASVIYDVMRQVERPDSVVTRETAKDPQKVLDLVRYILDA